MGWAMDGLIDQTIAGPVSHNHKPIVFVLGIGAYSPIQWPFVLIRGTDRAFHLVEGRQKKVCSTQQHASIRRAGTWKAWESFLVA